MEIDIEKDILTVRSQDGFRAIAEKIFHKLEVLRKSTENLGRWIWELLQNARDADISNSAVNVVIKLDNNCLEFSHDAGPFSWDDVSGLIHQISRKSQQPAIKMKTTGRYGTGFITTHLLSKKVKVKGIVKYGEKENVLRTFCFELDRDVTTLEGMIDSITSTWHSYKIDSAPHLDSTSKTLTTFLYQLQDDNKLNLARQTLDDFCRCLPLAMVFVNEIASVKIVHNDETKEFTRQISPHRPNMLRSILEVNNKGERKEHRFLKKSDNENVVDIAIPIEFKSEASKNGVIRRIEGIPKISCDFPLLGTENFPIPMFVNSHLFDTFDDRDGIYLKKSQHENEVPKEVLENRRLLEKAVRLYQEWLRESFSQYDCLFNIANTRGDKQSIDQDWFNQKIEGPIRECLAETRIVRTVSMKENRETLRNVLLPFPAGEPFTSEHLQHISLNKVMHSFFSILDPSHTPHIDEMMGWRDCVWYKLDNTSVFRLPFLFEKLSQLNCLGKLAEQIHKSNSEALAWLNNLLIKMTELWVWKHFNETICEYSVIPNENGNFKKCMSLFINDLGDDELIEIINKLTRKDIREDLVNKYIKFPDITKICKPFLASHLRTNILGTTVDETILTPIMKKFMNENMDNVDRTTLIPGVMQLLHWMDKNPALAEEHFSPEYNLRAEYFMKTVPKEKHDDFYSIMKCLQTTGSWIEIRELILEIERNPELLKYFQKQGLSNIIAMHEKLMKQNRIETENIKGTTPDIYSESNADTGQKVHSADDFFKQPPIQHQQTDQPIPPDILDRSDEDSHQAACLVFLESLSKYGLSKTGEFSLETVPAWPTEILKEVGLINSSTGTPVRAWVHSAIGGRIFITATQWNNMEKEEGPVVLFVWRGEEKEPIFFRENSGIALLEKFSQEIITHEVWLQILATEQTQSSISEALDLTSEALIPHRNLRQTFVFSLLDECQNIEVC